MIKSHTARFRRIRRRSISGPTLTQVTSRILEPWGFSVLDVENLRLHYAKALAHWLARFVHHAVSMEIDFPPVRGHDEAVALGKQSYHTAVLRDFVELHGSPLAPRVVLQPAPGDVEGFAYGHTCVFMHGIHLVLFVLMFLIGVLFRSVEARVAAHDDLPTGHAQVDPHVKATSIEVMAVPPFHEHTAAHNGVVVALEPGGRRSLRDAGR